MFNNNNIIVQANEQAKRLFCADENEILGILLSIAIDLLNS